MDTPVGSSTARRRRNKKSSSQYEDIGGPTWVNPDGTFKKGGCWNSIRYAPYGRNQMQKYTREITANLVKEFLGVMFISFMLPAFAAIGAGPDPVSRAIFIGLVAGASIFATCSWGYNDRLPRHLSPGATVAQFCSGNINWFIGVLELLVGFLASLAAAGVLYATGASTVPIVGGPNRTDIAGTFFVQLFFTGLIAYTVMDQKTTKYGKPKEFKKRKGGREVESTEANPIPNRVYQEDIGARPYLYGAIVFTVVSFCYLVFGLWTFNAYIYFAAAFGVVFIGGKGKLTPSIADPFNNLVPGTVSTRIGGIGALFILVEILAWGLAVLLDWLMYYLHNNESDRTINEDDDSSYAAMGDELDEEYVTVTRKPRSKKSARNNSPDTTAHLNADAWM